MIQAVLFLLLVTLSFSLFAMPAKGNIVQNAIKIDHLDQLPTQLLPLLMPYSVFLIGETHGTQESPTFCLGLIKMLAADKNRSALPTHGTALTSLHRFAVVKQAFQIPTTSTPQQIIGIAIS